MAKKTPEINATSTADIAFLLLVFFLATTTMNVDSGLYRRLPPYQPENEKAPEVAERNVLKLLVNQNDMVMLNDAPVDVNTIKDKTIEFILNPGNRSDLPSKEMKTIELFGPVEVSKGLISLKSDRSTSYRMYVAVQDQITAAFNEMRNMKANEKWGKNFNELTQEQQDAVKDVIPMLVSEAEPNVLGKKK